MAPRYNNNNRSNNNDYGDDDENDTNSNNNISSSNNNNNNEEWSDSCLYRRMLRGSQRIQMMKRRYQTSIYGSSGAKSKSILEQALETADIESTIKKNGIKVLHININTSNNQKSFDMRYFTIDSKCEHICLTPEPPNHYHNHHQTPPNQLLPHSGGKKKKSSSSIVIIDVADIDAWHVGTVATRRAELARRLETSRSKGTSEFDQVAMEKLLTIYYKGNLTLDLVVPVSQQMNLIVASLAEIHATFHRTQPWISKESSLLRYICGNLIPSMESNNNNDQIMTLPEFCQICEILNLGDKADAAFCFQSRTHQPTLPLTECMYMLRSLKPKRTQATVLWDFLFGANTHTISHKELYHKFLSQIQSEGHLSMRQAQALLTFIQTIEVAHPGDGGSNPQEDDSKMNSNSSSSLQKDQFEEFLYSDLNDAYDPQVQQLDQRLDQPLSSYWINTSFKTYWGSGSSSSHGGNNKEASSASVEGYMKALIRGAKCLDLDCWDGPSYNSTSTSSAVSNVCIPMVGHYHHHHHHSKHNNNNNNNNNSMDKNHLLFRHVCDVVEAYLKMHPQSYPIILSIENYCSPPYQEAMAKILQETLGNRLVMPSSSGGNNHHNNWVSLPSPEALRGRVLLHSKAYPEHPRHQPLEKKKKKRLSFLFRLRSSVATSGGLGREVEGIVGALEQLVFLEGGKLEGNLQGSNDNSKQKILSVTSSQQREMLQTGMKENDHRRHNASHLTRTHPTYEKSASSSTSNGSNNPVQAWSLGCQVVALRLDSSAAGDNSVLLNDGLFRQQNGVGYVQKPPFVLGLEPTCPISLFVRVLGGRCLPSSSSSNGAGGNSISPKSSLSSSQQRQLSVAVTLYDVQTTTTSNNNNNNSSSSNEQVYQDSHVTPSVNGSGGFAPVWKDRGKKFRVQQPDIAMVLFQVVVQGGGGGGKKTNNHTGGNCVVASAAIPVSCLRKGYRSIQFFDDNNCRTGALRYASLLVHIEY